MEKKFINNILICPKCGYNLVEINTNKLFLKCSNTNCISNIRFYNFFNDKPILIDENESVIEVKQIISSESSNLVKRPKYFKFRKLLQNIIHGSSIKTKKNLELITSLITHSEDSRILIIGGGTIGAGLDIFYEKYSKNITSFDVYYSKNIDFIADAHSIPIKSNTFDLVIIQAVLEHVLIPTKVVAEIQRVLKVGGLVYAETPFLQNVHEGAYDFTRFTVLGHDSLFSNYIKLKSGFIGGVGTSFLWSLEFLFASIFRSRLIGKIVRLSFFYLRFIDRVTTTKWNIDSACGSYFIGKKTNDKPYIHQLDLIKEYKGAQ
jgi:SAM-dependent methyltransferase